MFARSAAGLASFADLRFDVDFVEAGLAGFVEDVEGGIEHQLWAQQTLQGAKSALGGRPDLIVTSSLDLPNPNNAIRLSKRSV